MEANNIPGAICSLVQGQGDVGKAMAKDRNIGMMSFTGSTKVGRDVALNVTERFGMFNRPLIINFCPNLELVLS